MENRDFSRAVLLVLVAAVGLLAWQARGGPRPAAPTPVTVAVVSVERLVDGLTETKDREVAHKAALEAYQKQVDQAVQEVKLAEDNYRQMETGENYKSDPVYKAMRLKFREAEAVAKMRLTVLAGAKDLERGEIFSQLYQKATAAIAALAASEGYDLVLLNDSTIQLPEEAPPNAIIGAITARKVLFHAPRLDITQQVIDRMNNDYAASKGRQ